jgi:nitrous oxidase accessory protein NosD
MKGDFSRDTYDRKKHYNSVLMQQGRVQVDADWNEQQAIHQNRIETEAIDVIGKCGAPKYNAGFGITSAGGQFHISAGRFYVAGILCENEADTLYSEQPDLPNPPALGDLFSEAEAELGIVYLDVWKRHLTALDDPQMREVALGGADTATRLKTIWQVKVLPIAESDSNEDNLSCESEPPEWNELIAPSTGTLNAQTAEPDADSPCLIPPDAGYQRLENQLYRVEIHQGSNLGDITFKWSRDNGSVVTEIQRMDGQEVTVADWGRDEVLGFARGQWVEILDDALELNGLPGELVEIDDLTTDADGRPVILLATTPTPLAPVAEFPDGVNPDRHPKLRRWDQSGTDATANGVPISTDWIPLEGGIQVQFSDGTYKTGDYWLIPARTATGQIEWFQTDEPTPSPIPQLPLGIQHHYCRLAIAQFFPSDNPEGNELGILEVCDHDFPPLTELDPGECCCTVVVSPGESIQAALDSLPPAGGCVCLKTGVHLIREPIRIEKSNVVLKGESPGARVVRDNGLNLVVVARLRNQLITDVVVEQIRFEAAGVETQAPDLLSLSLLAMGNCVNVRVQHCRFEVAEAEQDGRDSTLPIAAALGMVVINSRQIALRENTLRLNIIGIWAEGCTDCEFSGNQLIAPILRVGDRLTIPLGYAGILLNLFPSENLLLGSDCQIINHSIQDFWLGIVTGVRSDRCQILSNQIRRQAMNQLPLQEPNNQFLAGNEPYLYGIITYGSFGTIADNFIELNSPSYGGIRAFGVLTRIENNTLQSNLTQALLAGSSQLPVGIFLGQLQPATPPGSVAPLPPQFLNYSVVKGNRLLGALTGIGAINAEGIEILENQIGVVDFVASLSTGVGLANTLNSVVSNNQIRGADLGIFLVGNFPTSGLNNRILHNHISDGGYGIGAVSETGLEVSGNFIENMTLAGFAATNLIENVYLTHNRIDHCGYQPPTSDLSNIAATPAIGAGIFIISVLGNLTLESCQIVNTGISRTGQITQGAAWGIAVGIVLACQITQNQVFYSDAVNLGQISLSQLHRSLLLVGWFLPTDNDLPYPQVGAALVTNNVFQGIGLPHLVEFLKNPNLPQIGFEQVNFSHNQCFHLRTQEQPSIGLTAIAARRGNATVSAWGRHLVVMGNQVKADNLKLTSIDLSNPERVTLMGNIATGAIINFEPGVTPVNPRDFNVYP